MAYGIPQLRQQNIMNGYDQLTPNMSQPQYQDDPFMAPPPGLAAVGGGGYDDSTGVLGPDGQPIQQGPTQAPTIAPPRVDPNAGTSFQDMIRMINEGYTPATKSRDRFDALLDAPPERQAPGWARAIAAGGIGIKSKDPIADMEKVMYAPYMRDIEDWKTKAAPFYQSAQLENVANTNERNLVGNAATAYTANERIRSQERIAQEKADISRFRAEAYDFKARNPNWIIKTDGPNVMAYDPTNQKPPVNLGPSGHLSDKEKFDLQGQYRVEAARVTGSEAAGRTVTSGSEYFQAPSGEIVTGNPRDPKVPVPPKGSTRVPSGNQSGGTTSTLERRRQEQDAMADAYTGDNATARKYMTGNERSGFIWKNRPTVGSNKTLGYFGTGTTQEEVDAYDRYRSSVDPNYKPPTKGLGPSSSNRMPDSTDQSAGMDPQRGEVTPDMPSTPPAGTIRMRTPDGRIVNVPANRVAEAEKRGGRRLR